MVKTYFVGKSVAVHLCNKKLIRKVPILLHTGQNECSVLTTAVCTSPKESPTHCLWQLLYNKKLSQKVTTLLHTGQNECSVLITAVSCCICFIGGKKGHDQVDYR